MNTLFQKMRNNRVKLEKAQDITDADPQTFYTDESGRMDALNTFIASGKRLDGNDVFVHGGLEVTIVSPIEGGNFQRFKYSGREYNRALAADRAIKSEKPKHGRIDGPYLATRSAWYKPSTWF